MSNQGQDTYWIYGVSTSIEFTFANWPTLSQILYESNLSLNENDENELIIMLKHNSFNITKCIYSVFGNQKPDIITETEFNELVCRTREKIRNTINTISIEHIKPITLQIILKLEEQEALGLNGNCFRGYSHVLKVSSITSREIMNKIETYTNMLTKYGITETEIYTATYIYAN